MSESASQHALNQRCKTLSRKWHPDKFKVVFVVVVANQVSVT